jgi:succinate--hydroxymethylglutarate CoA-transferase
MLPVLSGLRVIAVEQYGAGPYGSMQLADLGAEVWKIENPADGGDMARRVGPFFFGPDDSQFFHSFNRNKKSITLDLKKPAAARVLHALAARADALFDNLRGDLPAKLGLTYDALMPANPKIVCAHLSAYGRDGSRAHWPGYDYLMQAEAGYLSLTGEPDGAPTRMGLSIVDLMTGLFAAFALVSGVLAARETGRGRDLDVSLFDAALQNLCYLSTWYLNAGHVQGREPRSGHPSLVPSQLYRTADGFIFIMCNKEKFWPILCERLGRPEWAEDPRFHSFKDRLANRETVNRMLDEALNGSRISPGRSRRRRSTICRRRSTARLSPSAAASSSTVRPAWWPARSATMPRRLRASPRRRSAPTRKRCCAIAASPTVRSRRCARSG